MKHLLFIASSLLFLSCNQQNDDARTEVTKQVGIEELMVDYEDCKENASSRNECKHFIAQSICEYNGISDFKDQEGNYVDYHSIYDIILEDENYSELPVKWQMKIRSQDVQTAKVIDRQQLIEQLEATKSI